MVHTIWGTTRKPVSSQRLADFFALSDYPGQLYIGYPIIATAEGGYPIDAIWVSDWKGIVIFNLVEGRQLSDYRDIQDESANRLETKLRNNKLLMRGRVLLATPSVITFAPAIADLQLQDQDYLICNDHNISRALDRIPPWEHPGAYQAAVATLQSISSIRRNRRTRTTAKADSRGAILKRLEDSIANLDNLQGQAVIETVEGVQRIRGLAGSGKTIVLALKAAYLHAQHPEWRIAVTFNTRSLKDQFRRLITTFVFEQTGEEPNWDMISILNAWGAPGPRERAGVYYLFCTANEIEFFDFRTARAKFSNSKEFEGACEFALSRSQSSRPLFDVILVDEAQDFAPAFLRLCYEILEKPKRLVYAYDELQSLNEKSLLPPEELFGKLSDGDPIVQFQPNRPGLPQQDIVLEKCYRNSRPILATAHALGFGIYRKAPKAAGTGLIQMFDRNELWLDVGYSVVAGQLRDGQKVRLARTPETSPLFLEDHSNIDDLIQFYNFQTKDEQAAWLAEQIKFNIEIDELKPDDIIVINPDPLSTRKEVGLVRRALFDFKINSHLTGVDTSPDVFFDMDNESVTFSGIFRAKGNEAGMVYVMNADDCYASFGNLARVRNQLFTAITRSKAWVRVCGTGESMARLIEEFEKVKKHNFEIGFQYPTEQTRQYLNIVNRDMTEVEKQAVKSQSRNVRNLLKDFEAGTLQPEDLPEKDVEALLDLLNKSKRNARR